MEKDNDYFYVLKCAEGRLYAGYRNDLEKRVMSENSGKGAKYRRGRGGVEVYYDECFGRKREGMEEEYGLKTWRGKKKDVYIEEMGIEKEGGDEEREKV
ncbi:GIY-YIG nuclease family protein [Bacillus pumilus]|uniref:GIY-YIG nuclease family protein n=1 Tax=Bacillus pumilus TaxID=1408 RepID=UPI0011AA03D1|nr:GIY-YIG nuclease family protein [Bacillus pumilus]